MTGRNKLFTAVAIAALAAAGGFYLSRTPENNATAETATGGHGAEAPTAPTNSRPAITVAAVAKAVLNDRVRASGLIAAVERVQLQPQVEGQAIDSIHAEVGDHVKAGAVLARLSDSALKLQRAQLDASLASARAQIAQAQAQLVEAKSAYDEAKRQWERADQLKKKGNASQAAADQAFTAASTAEARVMVATQGLEAARAQVGLVEAQIADVELKLARTLITAPVAGKIVERNAEVGAIASAAGDPMFVLIRDGQLELNADIAEQDLPRLATGMRASLRAAGSAETLTGTVRLIEPSIDTTTRLGRARITVDQSDRIRTGMFLEAEILISTREVVAVPITALGIDAEGSYVMTVDAEGMVHRNGVVTGIRDGGQVEIIEGVADGALVVAKAASFVRDGDKVNPVTPAASAPTGAGTPDGTATN